MPADDQLNRGGLLAAWARRVATLETDAAQRAYLTRIVTNEALRVRRDPYRKRKLHRADVGEREAAGEPVEGKVEAFPTGS